MAQIAKIAIEAATFAIDKPYDYLVPDGMEVRPGMRVTVPFGRGNRRSEGMVLAVEPGLPDRPLKAVEALLDETPQLSREQIRLGLDRLEACVTRDMTEEEKETLIRLLQKVEHNAETAWRLARTGKEKPL